MRRQSYSGIKCTFCALAVACAIIILSSSGVSADTCTESQAFNKMMALNRAQGRMMNGGNITANSPAVLLAKESAPIGQLMAQKKFGDACAQYDALATKYKIDLVAESKGLLTLEQLTKDGGKGNGTCSVADASKKLMGLHQQLENKAAKGDVSRDVFKTFGEDTKAVGELMVTNPTKACELLDTVKTKYQLE